MITPTNWIWKIPKMDRINDIWSQLEIDRPALPGLLKVRYSPDVVAELYLGVLMPGAQRCLLLRINSRDIRNAQVDRNLRGLKMQKMADPNQPDFIFLNLILLDRRTIEIFDILIQDIINIVSPLTDEKKILRYFIERVDTWRMLFDKAELETLSAEAQQGLYGELYFLRKWIGIHGDNKSRCVTAWLGTTRELRDFQIEDWAVEVKTTRGNNHQKVYINSDRQLDPSNLNILLLYHISLEVQQQNGENLNQIVGSILALLSDDIITETQFKAKLLLGGYLSAHKPFYDDRGYQVRGESFYEVRDDFPRIEERTVPKGVGDVSYSIIVSECGEYKADEYLIFERIK
jgi:Putative  PD-(D/E)XK family member, (DUF4420)